MAKFCSNCGNELNENSAFCTNCGCAIPDAQASAPVTPNFENVPNAPAKKTQVSMILGIIGIVFAWLFALVGHVLSIIGIVIGVKEYKQTGKSTGLVLSIIGESCAIFNSILGAIMMSSMYSIY